MTAIDFLGFGSSRCLTKAFSVGDYAMWTAGVFKALGIEKPLVLAHSFGCRVAIKMAGEGVYDFERILLTGPAGIILKRGFSYKCRVQAYRICKKFFPSFAEKRFGSAEYRTLSPIMKESYKKIVNEDLREVAKKVPCPVLVVEGEADRVTTRKEAEIYVAALHGGALKMIEGGHFAFAENPAAFNLIAEEFFYG